MDLSGYAGQNLYVRIEYKGGTWYYSGGIWIDSFQVQEVTCPEREGQPIHYTVLTNLPAGKHILSAELFDTNAVAHARSPTFTLTVDDEDGMPADWEERYGLDITTNDAAGDPDGDGYSNWQEYLSGSVPTNGTSAGFWITESSAGIGAENIRFRIESQTNCHYTVQFKTNLAEGGWETHSTFYGTGNAVWISDTNSLGQCFYRVLVGEGL